MMYRTVPSLLAGLAVALATGCGGDDGASAADALTPGDSGVQADGGDPCTYQEADDDGNGVTGEATGLAIGDGALVICGQIRALAPVDEVVDRDRYQLEVGAAVDVVVRLHAPDGRDVAVLEVGLDDDGASLGRGRFVGNHGVFLGQLAPGVVVLEIVAVDTGAPPAAIAYQVEITADDRATRCPAGDGTATFTEAGDTAINLHTGNDMVELALGGGAIAQTAATSDAPEATNLVITQGMTYQLAGALAVNGGAVVYADDYLDRDTFLIATGAQTTELSVRVTWPADDTMGNGDDADLDVVLFRVPTTSAAPPLVAAGAHRSHAPPELETTAVLPSSTYWLWVGNAEGSAEPTAYRLTICGADQAR